MDASAICPCKRNDVEFEIYTGIMYEIFESGVRVRVVSVLSCACNGFWKIIPSLTKLIPLSLNKAHKFN